MSFPIESKIQSQEKAKRRRNAIRGRECAKGTIPQYYRAKAEKALRETWFDRLRARIKSLWQRYIRKESQNQAPRS